MNICITGGAGFIGSYMIEHLLAMGHSVVCYDLRSPLEPHPDVQYVQGDICDKAKLQRALMGCQAVIHLAAAHHDFGIAAEEYHRVNVDGARALCSALDANGIRDICFYSTVAVYGEAPEPRTEQTAPKPTSPYGRSKLEAEEVFRAWTTTPSPSGEQATPTGDCNSDNQSKRCVVIRPTVTFGPRNFANMYFLIRQIAQRRFIRAGRGDNIKSLSYVENIVAATLYLWRPGERLPGDGPFEVFNYIDKPDLTSRQIINAIYHALGRRSPRLYVPLSIALVASFPFDVLIWLTGRNLPISRSRIRKLGVSTRFEAERIRQRGYSPQFTVEDGIQRMVRWYQQTGHTNKERSQSSS